MYTLPKESRNAVACAGTETEQLPWTLKREKSAVKAVRKRMFFLFTTAFTIVFLRFEVQFSCVV